MAVLAAKLKDYANFFKLRLTSLVLVSAFAGYWLATPIIDWAIAFWVVFGGALVTASSNGFNQIIERDLDKLMKRTQSRPLPQGKMNVLEALVLSSVVGSFGIFFLWVKLNPLSGILGALALISYVAVYTPMKRISPIGVFIGAIPGALPPMIGYVAYTGKMGLEPGILFLVQFMWQFPHFWAIAWKSHDDYQKGGFKMLPAKNQKNKASALWILISAVLLIPTLVLPYLLKISGIFSLGLNTVLSIGMTYLAFKFYRTLNDKDATRLMFASFFYLPLVLFFLVIDKI